MNKRNLAVRLCKAEGKKHQVNIADMLEIISCLEEIFASDRAKSKCAGKAGHDESAFDCRIYLLATDKIDSKQGKSGSKKT